MKSIIHINIYKCLEIVCCFLIIHFSKAQTDSSLKRSTILWIGTGITYGCSMSGLYYTWYDSYQRSSFHWFNDNNEWLQMDKFGHFYTAFQLNRGLFNALIWAGYNKNKATVYASLTSFGIVSSIELFDAFFPKWGASWGDLVSNLMGVLTFSFQKTVIKKDVMTVKFSTHLTPLAPVRPNVLGNTIAERIIKDYNGQTYWINLNIHELFSTFKPRWLALSIGFSAYNMVYARENEQLLNPQHLSYERLLYDRKPYRRFFISFDINVDKLVINNRFLKNTLKLFDVIKIPFPAIEIHKHAVQWHYCYF